ncbi:MAG: hypothetical protein AAGB46_11835, partial [Verrucomicrobiota bacterium]
MKRNSTVLLLIIALFWSGCETTHSLDYTGEDAGYVVLGIGSIKPVKYAELFLKYRDIENGNRDSFKYFYKNRFYAREPDYSNESEEGVVVIQTLKPGNYEIYNYSLYEKDYVSQTTHYLEDDVSIPFTIKQGEITYLGNFQANTKTSKNMFGIDMLAGATFKITNREELEIKIAKKGNAEI